MMEKKLPKGWVETKLDTVVFPKKGKKPQKLESEEFKNSVPYLDIYSLEKGIVRQYADAGSSNLMDDSMIAIVWDGARSGWVSKGMYGAIGSTLAALKPINVDINYIFYFLQSKFNEINTNPRGIGIPHVDPTLLWNLVLPLPPLPTQQRIVAKLDSLFARIDQMKSSMERIPQLLKAFRQSVLTQAVTGKLTEEWREGKELEEWKTYPLSDISESKLGKMLDQKKNIGIQTKYLRNINVRWFSFDLNDLQEMKAQQDELKKYKIENGDVLICEGGEPGRAAIWSGESSNLIFQKALHRVRMNSNVLPEILVYNLKVDSENNTLNQLFTGTTIKHLTGKSLSNYEIEVPPLEEQQEIVRQVESLFAKADRIDAQYQSLKAKIEQLPQALLAKAFRGELVEQLPEDGDARELLEALRQAQRPGKGEMERRGIPHSGTGKKENVKPKSEKILRRAQDDTVLKQVAEPEGKYWGKK